MTSTGKNRPSPRRFTSNRTFTNFSSLPRELRDFIWRLTLPGPRIIAPHLVDAGHSPSLSLQAGYSHHRTIPERSPRAVAIVSSKRNGPDRLLRVETPVALWVCSESRKEALRFFQATAETSVSRPFYVDVVRDTIAVCLRDGDWVGYNDRIPKTWPHSEIPSKPRLNFCNMVVHIRCRKEIPALYEDTLPNFEMYKNAAALTVVFYSGDAEEASPARQAWAEQQVMHVFELERLRNPIWKAPRVEFLMQSKWHSRVEIAKWRFEHE